MVRLSRLFRDYADAGAVSDIVNLWGFVDETTFLTKAGAVGQVFRLDGVDVECLDEAERRQVAHQLERALRADVSVRLYQYLLKRPARPVPHADSSHPVVQDVLDRREAYFARQADRRFEIDLYLVVLSERWARRRGRPALPAWSVRRQALDLAGELDRAIGHLRDQAQTIVAQLSALGPMRLTKQGAYTFFRSLLNYDPAKVEGVRLKSDGYLDFFSADSAVDCYRDHLDVDGYTVKVLTMKEPPARTFASLLHDLAALPTAFTACLEWQALPADRARRDIRARRRHHFNRRIALINYVSPQTRPEDMLVDESATATVRELGEGLTALDVDGQVFGACSVTLVIYGRDTEWVDRHAAEAIKVFAGHDGALFEESYNLLNAWLAVVPGNTAHNLRRLTLLNTNAADLNLTCTHRTGEPTSAHLGGPCLAVLETAQQTPYYWHLHYGDVGHTLIQGATGAGKSFLCNFLVAHAQQYDPVTFVFDLGGSYDQLIRRLGGSVWRVGLDQREFTINPFCLPPTAEHTHFLFSLTRVLIQSSGQHTLTLAEDRDLYEAVENVYALDVPQRRLLTLANLLPRPLAQHLHRWVQGGPYAALFDNEVDTLTVQRLQGFDFEGLERFPMLLEPLLFYVLHRASAAVADATADQTLKLFVLDEAWRFAKDPTVKAYITEALKTWRKRNAAMVLATQSGEDFLDPDLLRTVLESCPTKVFLANPALDPGRASDLFHLNATETALVHRLAPRRQALIKRPDLSKVVNLVVDPASARMFTPARAGGADPTGSRGQEASSC